MESQLETFKETIASRYKQANKTSEAEVIGINLDKYGRLFMDVKSKIRFEFYVKHINELKYLKLFFEPRLKFEYAKAYIYVDHLTVYPQFYSAQLSEFQKAMELTEIFRLTYEAIQEYIITIHKK